MEESPKTIVQLRVSLILTLHRICSTDSDYASVLYIYIEFKLEEFCTNRADGNYQHPIKCTYFISCSGNRVFERPCLPGFPSLFYNLQLDQCDYPSNVQCLELQGEACYGAKDSSFGTITMLRGGTLRQLSLEHSSGFVSCNITNPKANSNWGCGIGFLSVKMGTVVTYTNDTVVFTDFKLDKEGYYFLARTDTFSRALTLFDFDEKIQVEQGQQLRIWHGEDLVNKNEENNGGQHCVRVWASFYERK